MGAFQERYTAAQRDAIGHAWNVRGIRPASRVAALAAAGELEPDLEPFTIPEGSVRDVARRDRRKRAGQERSAVQKLQPRDAVEQLRLRLAGAIDHELRRVERKQADRRRVHVVDPEQLRQLARAVRELAAIPGPSDPRPVAPGQRDPQRGGRHNDARTRGGLAGQLLAAAAQPATPAPTHSTSTPHRDTGTVETRETSETDDGRPDGGEHDGGQPDGQADGMPGSFVRERVARLAPQLADPGHGGAGVQDREQA